MVLCYRLFSMLSSHFFLHFLRLKWSSFAFARSKKDFIYRLIQRKSCWEAFQINFRPFLKWNDRYWFISALIVNSWLMESFQVENVFKQMLKDFLWNIIEKSIWINKAWKRISLSELETFFQQLRWLMIKSVFLEGGPIFRRPKKNCFLSFTIKQMWVRLPFYFWNKVIITLYRTSDLHLFYKVIRVSGIISEPQQRTFPETTLYELLSHLNCTKSRIIIWNNTKILKEVISQTAWLAIQIEWWSINHSSDTICRLTSPTSRILLSIS